jgi:hypothetical protein
MLRDRRLICFGDDEKNITKKQEMQQLQDKAASFEMME